MNITEEIRENFNRGYFGKSMRIKELPDEYPAWTLKQNHSVAVAVPVEKYIPFSEQFASVKIHTAPNVEIGKKLYNILMLESFSMESREEFAVMCRQFVDPGKDGEFRKKLISEPVECWKRWKDMLGNVSSDKAAYDIFGELLVLEKMLSGGKNVRWSGCEYATHDIESDSFSIEVKSTTTRYGYEITISSIYQMNPVESKPLYLSFIRFEKSELGRSVNDVVQSLKQLGFDAALLESALKKRNLEEGRVARNEKYKVLEWKQYPVDDVFPRITESSFKDNCLPQNIVKITYTVQ